MAKSHTSSYSQLVGDVLGSFIVLGEAIEDCNSQACRLWGKEHRALVGKSLLELSPATQLDGTPSREVLAVRLQAARAGLPQSFEWQFQRGNDEPFAVLVTLRLAEGNRNNGRLVCRLRDINSLHQAETALRESEARFQQILNNAAAAVYVKDREGRYLFVNWRYLRIFHRKEAEILGKSDYDVFPAAIADAFRQNDLRVLAATRALEFEEKALLADGEHTYLSSKFPLFNAEGEVYAVCGISTDITERKRIEEALRNVALGVSGAKGKNIFRELVRYLTISLGVDCAFVGKLVRKPTERIRTLAAYDHGKFLENIEYELKGTPCEHVVGKQFEYIPTNAPLEFPGDLMLQDMRFDSYAAYPLFDAQGQPLGIIAALARNPLQERSLTEAILKIFSVRAAAELERLQADEARRISEASYRAIFEASEDAIFIHDLDTGAILDVNPKACKIYGYSYQELRQINIGSLSSGEPPYTLAAALQFIEQAKAGKPLRFEWHRKNKDGSLHWDEVVLKRAMIAGVDRILAVTRDISERKQAEAERTRLEAQLRQAQKMEAIGHLTGGIAHDFNNILTGVMGYIVLATERAEQVGDEKLSKYLNRAYRSGLRARDLIQQMLTFSRGRRGEPRALLLGPLIAESVKLLSATLPSSLEIQLNLNAKTPPVLVDPVQVEQVLINLCINARDAMNGSGRLRISLSPLALQNTVCASCHQTFTGEFVGLAVRDTGSGILPEKVERIFEPFFTTKEVGKGSGMGLATVHGIVHEYGGHITLQTLLGKGSEFQVLFSALATDGWEAASSPPASAAPARKVSLLQGRVLIVDDDLGAGEFMEDLLGSWGLQVRFASDAIEAGSIFASNPQDFQLALLDQTMPRMTGVELAKQLLAVRPDLTVILYTGDGESLPEEQVRLAGIRALVKKPVDTERLYTLIYELLPNS
jgi:PAS domain S-box-containing protein